MKKTLILLSAAVFLLCGCTSSQFAGVTTGSALGGMFGSSVGGIFGGPRGHDLGGAIGMLAGGAIGAAATAERTPSDGSRSGNRDYADEYDNVEYGSYRNETRRHAPAPASSPWEYLEVASVRFDDSNGNRCLDAGEHAFLMMEIYNRSDRAIYDIAPQIACDNRRVVVSPPAIVSALEAGCGFRYRAEIIAPERLKDGTATFTVAFGSGKQRTTAKTFRIRTAR